MSQVKDVIIFVWKTDPITKSAWKRLSNFLPSRINSIHLFHWPKERKRKKKSECNHSFIYISVRNSYSIYNVFMTPAQLHIAEKFRPCMLSEALKWRCQLQLVDNIPQFVKNLLLSSLLVGCLSLILNHDVIIIDFYGELKVNASINMKNYKYLSVITVQINLIRCQCNMFLSGAPIKMNFVEHRMKKKKISLLIWWNTSVTE